MKPPKGAETDPDIIWKAVKPIYGLCDSVKNWQLTVIEWFREIGAKPAEADQAVFVFSDFHVKSWYSIEPLKKIKGVDDWSMRPELLSDIKPGKVFGVCAAHVDDIFFMGVPEFIGWFQDAIKQRFKVKPSKLNDIIHVGLRVRKLESGDVMVSSEDYERNIESIRIEPERRRDVNAFLIESEEKDFRSQLGKIMWLARITRADITYEAAAVAQAFAESENLEQNYDVTSFENYELKDEKVKEVSEPSQTFEGNKHIPGFDDFANKNRPKNEEVNKINLHKTVQKNTGDNFKTSLRVKNLIYLNKVIAKIHARRDTAIYFKDVTNGRGRSDVRLVVYSDASLYNVNEKQKSQIGYFAVLMSLEERYIRPDGNFRPSVLKKEKKPLEDYARVTASPVSWRSFKSPLVAGSSFTSELQAISLGVDAACCFRSLISEIMFGTPLRKVYTEVRGDNLSVIRAVQSLSNHITREKRFQSIISTVQQVIENEEVDHVIWVPTSVNLADGLTKAMSGNQICDLLVYNHLRVPEEDILNLKWLKTHLNKQHLVNPDKFLEIEGGRQKRKRNKDM